jgi:uncharacterized protein YebE (UPF0316 family)
VSTMKREEIKEIIDKMVATRSAIEAEWKAGRRDGPRLQVFALAQDVERMLDAIQKDDANAFRVAATEAREHAGSASMHAVIWLNKIRGALS